MEGGGISGNAAGRPYAPHSKSSTALVSAPRAEHTQTDRWPRPATRQPAVSASQALACNNPQFDGAWRALAARQHVRRLVHLHGHGKITSPLEEYRATETISLLHRLHRNATHRGVQVRASRGLTVGPGAGMG